MVLGRCRRLSLWAQAGVQAGAAAAVTPSAALQHVGPSQTRGPSRGSGPGSGLLATAAAGKALAGCFYSPTGRV